MPDVAFAIPGDLATRTGGYAYDRQVLKRLPGLGIPTRHLPLPGSYPFPSTEDLEATARCFAELPASTVLLADGLAYGAMPADLLARVRQPIIALVHHPLGYETGLSPERAKALVDMERQALSFARRVVVTSPLTRRLLAAEFGVPEEAITVAAPGTEPGRRAHGDGNPPHLLAVGSVSPRKGFNILIAALAPLKTLRWRLTIAGSLERDPAAAQSLRESIARHGLGGRVDLPGELEEAQLAHLYGVADIFVLPSLFEGYGMVLGEAMARGLPIICTTGGAAAETVPESAALKVPPGLAPPLTAALQRLLTDDLLRQRLADSSWEAGRRLPDWGDTALYIAAVIREVAP